jgi:hypothetical protein
MRSIPCKYGSEKRGFKNKNNMTNITTVSLRRVTLCSKTISANYIERLVRR